MIEFRFYGEGEIIDNVGGEIQITERADSIKKVESW
jgi:hypothetical protein